MNRIRVQKAHNYRFAGFRRDSGNPDFHFFIGHSDSKTSVLRLVADVHFEIGKEFYSGNKVFVIFERKISEDVVQKSVQTETDFCFFFLRLKVNIGRANGQSAGKYYFQERCRAYIAEIQTLNFVLHVL